MGQTPFIIHVVELGRATCDFSIKAMTKSAI